MGQLARHQKQHLPAVAVVIQSPWALRIVAEAIVGELDDGVPLLQTEIAHCSLMRAYERRNQYDALSRFHHALILVGASGLNIVIALPAIAAMNLKAWKPQEKDIADSIVSPASNLNASDRQKAVAMVDFYPFTVGVEMHIIIYPLELSSTGQYGLIIILLK